MHAFPLPLRHVQYFSRVKLSCLTVDFVKSTNTLMDTEFFYVMKVYAIKWKELSEWRVGSTHMADPTAVYDFDMTLNGRIQIYRRSKSCLHIWVSFVVSIFYFCLGWWEEGDRATAVVIMSSWSTLDIAEHFYSHINIPVKRFV